MSKISDVSMTQLSRRDMLRLTGFVSVGLLAAACAPAAAPSAGGGAAAPAAATVKLVATTQMPITQWANTTKRLKDAFPDLDVELTQTDISAGWASYSDKIMTQIAGGDQLDLLMIAIEGLRLVTNKNVLTPLDDFLAADAPAKEAIETDVHKTLREMMQVDGKQMEYPFSWNNMVLHYNTKMMADKGIEAPKAEWTWDDFLETSQKLSSVKGGADDVYGYSFWGSSMFGMSPWFFSHDTSVLTDDWKDSNLMDPKVAETLQFLADLILKHKVAPNPQGWDEGAQFVSSHLGMRTCGRWCLQPLFEQNFIDYDLQYQPSSGSGKIRTVAGTDGWGITTSTKAPDQAWKVLKMLSDKDASIDMVTSGGNVPALRSVAEMPLFAENGPKNTAIFYESLDYAKTVPAPTNFNIIDPILNRHYQTIWNGEKSVQEAVEAAHKELQAEMDKLK